MILPSELHYGCHRRFTSGPVEPGLFWGDPIPCDWISGLLHRKEFLAVVLSLDKKKKKHICEGHRLWESVIIIVVVLNVLNVMLSNCILNVFVYTGRYELLSNLVREGSFHLWQQLVKRFKICPSAENK